MTLEQWVRRYALPLIHEIHECDHNGHRVPGMHASYPRAPHPPECRRYLEMLEVCPIKSRKKGARR